MSSVGPDIVKVMEARRAEIGAQLSRGQMREALAAADAAIAALPQVPGFRLFRAIALLELRRPDEVLETLNAMDALGVQPTPQSLQLRATALWRTGHEEEAIEVLARAIALAPNEHRAREIFGRYCLALGRHDPGWAESEHRLARLPPLPFRGVRRWAGEPLAGKHIAVIGEQGLGDTLQFARFLPTLCEQGATVTAVVQPALLDVMRSMKAPIAWTSEFATSSALDFQVELLSLPLLFGTRLEAIPQEIPYLFAEPERSARWKARLGPAGRKIGIAWQGSTGPMRDDERSLPPGLIAALAAVPGVRLISLQAVNGLDLFARLPAGIAIERLGPDVESNPRGTTEIAAIMASLDLVITSDTMVAHLAGALGRPVWVGLKFDAEWRWMRRRADSPWYPQLRLFRQKSPGDWPGVADDLVAALKRP